MLTVAGERYAVVDLAHALRMDPARLPVVLRVLAENVARTQRGQVREDALSAIAGWVRDGRSTAEIPVTPGRLLMHDTTSTPALVDIAAMRDAVAAAGSDPALLSPLLPVEVSVDHSVGVDAYARADAVGRNMAAEMRRNRERYAFLKWADQAMDTLHVNPPGTGIMHTINLEQLATVVTTTQIDGRTWAVPDLMVGTDSHTPMVNGLGVLGWGVGGLEAQTVMFGMPITLQLPDVVGVRLTGRPAPGVTATDIALTITSRLRQVGVTGEFVEFYGPGVGELTVGDRAVIANMAPEYGATTGYFPIDQHVLDYLRSTGRPQERLDLVAAYAEQTGLWLDPHARPRYTRTLHLDLGAVRTSVAGPRRPQDLLLLQDAADALRADAPHAQPGPDLPAFPVALAAITSCTNTTDPRLLITAGLVARNARARGLSVRPWVKTSLAPGSPAAATYLARSGLREDLAALGFDIVGFGCTTCIGNSGDIPARIEHAARTHGVAPVAALSGNRNFPGRVHPDLDLGLLMSPPLVVAFALTGDATVDPTTQPLGQAPDGQSVYLADLWPTEEQVRAVLDDSTDPGDFARDFRAASRNRLWHDISAPHEDRFPWDPASTTLRPPPFADADQGPLLGSYTAHPLLVLGDDVTTDHISPAGAIPADSDVADFLVDRGEDRHDLNVYASRRGNWEVMARGAFHNRSLRNGLAPQAPTGHTVHSPSGLTMPIWDAATRYAAEGAPVVVVAGERYGMGSSRDWAAKAARLLGVRAVIASGFERIHRTNLIGMGILPLLAPADVHAELQDLRPGDTLHVHAPVEQIAPAAPITVTITRSDGPSSSFSATSAIETTLEVHLLGMGGVIPTILQRTLAAGAGRPAGSTAPTPTRDARERTTSP